MEGLVSYRVSGILDATFGDRLERGIEWLMIALLSVMPFAFGAVERWSEEVVLVLVALISLCFLAKVTLVRDSRLTWTWAYVPLLIFLLIVAAQLVPWPVSWLRLVSPNTVSRKTELLSDLLYSDQVLSWMTISFYPYATVHGLRLIFAVAVVFVVVLNVYHRMDQVEQLLAAIVVIGGGVALLSLTQHLFGNGKIYWLVTSPHGEAHSGPFVNHSHYAQFMNLSIGAALALLFVKIHQGFLSGTVTLQNAADYLASRQARLIWGLVAMLIVGLGTVFLSLSRGGVISMLVAATFTTLVLSTTKALRGAGWIIALLALGAFVCVLYLGFDAVYDRLGTLSDLEQAQGGRWQMLADVAVAWTRFPLLGTGLGTHEVVYPEFDRSTIPAVASHAENEYAQAAEETGVLGLLCLVVFGVLVGVHYVRAVKARNMAASWAAFGLGFGLLAILMHSLSDFGQHIPANAMLSVIFCALLVRLSFIARAETEAEWEVSGFPRRLRRLGPGLLVVWCLLWGVMLMEADRARAAEAQWTTALDAEQTLMANQWQGSDAQYVVLLRHAAKAADGQPDNIKYQHWLNMYRWYSVSRTADPDTGDLVLNPETLTFVERIAEQLSRARRICPTFGTTWCVLGQLERFILNRPEDGKRHIEEGVKLAPCDATARFVAGRLALEEGKDEVAQEHLGRAVDLDWRLYREVASLLIERFDRPAMALAMAGDEVGRLNVIANLLDTTRQNSASVAQVRAKLVTLLEEKCRQPGVSAWTLAWLAGIYWREGRMAQAETHYRQALAKEYSQIDWRFDLARVLSETGALREALQEAEICQRLQPGQERIGNFIESLSTKLLSASE